MARQLKAAALRLLHAYESVQVELHGNYSVERMIKLDEYVSMCSPAWAVAVLLATPLPSLLVTVLADTVPLRPASEGFAASQLFWWRVALVASCVTFTILEQLRCFLPRLSNQTHTATATASVIIGIGCSAYGVLMAHLVGFPLPFTLFFGSPSWQVLFWGYIAVNWGRRLYHDRSLRQELIGFYKVVVMQLSLTFIYPVYNYGFTLLDGSAQTGFALLLPVIKVAAKNAFSSVFTHSEDFRPEVVIFNVEIFHALFVSTCMQSSTSPLTTGVLVAADILQAWLHVRDIDALLRLLQALDQSANAHQAAAAVAGQDVRVSPFKRALVFVAMDKTLHHDPRIRMRSFALPTPRPSTVSPDVKDKATKQANAPPRPSIGTIQRTSPVVVDTMVQPSPDETILKDLCRLSRAVNDSTAIHSSLSRAERRQYVTTVLRVLHFTEFLLLIEFVEFVVPLVYGSYLVVIFHLPNRVYYPALAHISAATLWSRVSNIFTYAAFELVSLVAICFVLQRRLSMSPVKQLVFVLDKQWRLVQSKMVLWVLVVVETSLEQFGYDYTFQFAWLKASRGG